MIGNGGTRRFIGKEFIVKKNLPTKDVEGIYVTKANDYYTIYNKKVRVRINMEDYILENDFYIFPQDGLQQVMLGVQWMYPLECVQTNFQTQEVSFTFKGKKVTIKELRIHHEL